MKYVLFVCNHNAGRSQMAHAFFERHAPADIRAESAGSQPARQVWPEVVEVMREVSIDLEGRRPKRLLVEMQLHADWAVRTACGDACPYVPTTVEASDIPDPAQRPIEEVRAIRDSSRPMSSTSLSSAWTPSGLTARPISFASRGCSRSSSRSSSGVARRVKFRACADAILSRYDDVPIRSHVRTLAHRQTCDCLSQETCDVLAATS
jgi:arsenate reductase